MVHPEVSPEQPWVDVCSGDKYLTQGQPWYSTMVPPCPLSTLYSNNTTDKSEDSKDNSHNNYLC